MAGVPDYWGWEQRVVEKFHEKEQLGDWNKWREGLEI